MPAVETEQHRSPRLLEIPGMIEECITEEGSGRVPRLTIG
jgi:hypothetical protein